VTPVVADAAVDDDDVVRAAGAVPWRRRSDGAVEVAVVHRPRYDDWSFPKGKLEPGESFVEGAVREVAEETGLSGVIGAALPEVRYVDHRGRPKVVRWWLLEVTASDADVPTGATPQPGAVPNDEVDELRWLAPPAAARLVTYEADADLARLAATALGVD